MKFCNIAVVSLLVAFQMQGYAIKENHTSFRRRQLRPDHTQSEPCLLMEKDVLHQSEAEITPYTSSWRCRVHGQDAAHAGAKKGEHGIVQIEGIEQVLAANNANIQSGVTTLLAERAIIENHTLKIPPGAQLTFGTMGDLLGTSRTRELAVTKDVTKTVLAVRVIANDNAPGSDIAEISDNIFGTYGDNVNLKTQMEGCSHGRLMIEKASDGGVHITEGVVEIEVNLNAAGTVNDILEEAAENELESLFETNDLSSLFDHIMLCLPPGTIYDDGSGWIGYGYYNRGITVYNDDWCNYPSIQMHEIGHNLYLGHAGEGTNNYGDQSGVMGYSYRKDEGPTRAKMCYNPAKSWQLGWYDANSPTIFPLTQAWNGKLVGVANYDSNAQDESVVLKLEDGRDAFYIGFNHATGFHSGTVESINKVTVVTQGSGNSKSWKQAELDAGDTLVITDYLGSGEDITIKVTAIITGSEGYAHVKVYKGEECGGTCCYDTTDCVHECATGTCQAGSCTFDPITCPGSTFPPTEAPTQSPYPRLVFVRGGSIPYFYLGECESDCDGDDDCDFGLVCYQRSSGQPDVPGCSGNADMMGDGDGDFCVKPPTANTLVLMGDDDEPRSFSAFPLGECQGDCDSDSDCGDGLACFQRSGNEVVPGCIGGDSGSDYCYRLPTDSPTTYSTASPTKASITSTPTGSPANSPTETPSTSQTTDSHTNSPTSSSTDAPTGSPTNSPTEDPTTSEPTDSPMNSPTEPPTTSEPTDTPTKVPTTPPTSSPTETPSTSQTTDSQINSPPSSSTDAPTDSPTNSPTEDPTTSEPTDSPMNSPTEPPTTSEPTDTPIKVPTTPPTSSPTETPSTSQTTDSQTNSPTSSSTDAPTGSPTNSPTEVPTTSEPTDSPMNSPTEPPTTSEPTDTPTKVPTTPPTTLLPTSSSTESPTKAPTTSPTKLMTDAPTTSSPTNGPNLFRLISPPVTPAPSPTFEPALVFVRGGSLPYFYLRECESDCDGDDDCDFGLVCYQRSSGQQDVPGCSGNADVMGDGNENFCMKPLTANTLVLMGDDDEPRSFSAFPLGECQGDCDSDSDCDAGLACFQRSGNETVPGCIGGDSGSDYCYRPPPAESPTTSRLTDSPTKSPTKAPTTPLPTSSSTQSPTKALTTSPTKLLTDVLILTTPSPINGPTLFPTTSPPVTSAPIPTLEPALVFVQDGRIPRFFLGACESDCDDDDDCDFGLVCYKRSFGEQDVPGCSGNADMVGDTDEDFCIKPPTADILVLMGNGKETRSQSAFPLGECQGDCDSDSDCGDGLACFFRRRNEAVPGCSGGDYGWDYCYRLQSDSNIFS